MRKLLIVLLCLLLDATCFAQRGGFRGGGGGRGFSGGSHGGFVSRGFSGRGFGGGFVGRGFHGGFRRGFDGFGFRNRFVFGFGYDPWFYWPYWDYGPYGWGGYPYYPYAYYPAAPGPWAGGVAYSDPRDPPPANNAYVNDGKWHHFGERQAVADSGNR